MDEVVVTGTKQKDSSPGIVHFPDNSALAMKDTMQMAQLSLEEDLDDYWKEWILSAEDGAYLFTFSGSDGQNDVYLSDDLKQDIDSPAVEAQEQKYAEQLGVIFGQTFEVERSDDGFWEAMIVDPYLG